MAQLTNLGSLGATANASGPSSGNFGGTHLLPTLTAANAAFQGASHTGMPTVSFGFVGGDTQEGDTAHGHGPATAR